MFSSPTRSALFATLLLTFVAGFSTADFTNASAESSVNFNSRPACEVIGKGWKRHVYRPWLDTGLWYVEPDKPDVSGFQYRVTVRYNGDRVVREVVWDYIFLNPSDGSEVSRHSFDSVVRLKPGRVKELTAFSVKAPTKFVNASAVKDNGEPLLIEKVAIRSIVYEDGSSESF